MTTNITRFIHSQVVWDTKTCNKLARKIQKDGMGTPYPFKGYLPNGLLGHYAFGRIVDYNGGCIRNGEWYPGEEWPLPLIAPEFEITYILNWGYRIRLREGINHDTCATTHKWSIG